MDTGSEIRAELGGKPDLIIGNYSDGNLVASLLSFHLNVTQCTIAHAFEKTKYPDADVYWCVLSLPTAFGSCLRCTPRVLHLVKTALGVLRCHRSEVLAQMACCLNEEPIVK